MFLVFTLHFHILMYLDRKGLCSIYFFLLLNSAFYVRKNLCLFKVMKILLCFLLEVLDLIFAYNTSGIKFCDMMVDQDSVCPLYLFNFSFHICRKDHLSSLNWFGMQVETKSINRIQVSLFLFHSSLCLYTNSTVDKFICIVQALQLQYYFQFSN